VTKAPTSFVPNGRLIGHCRGRAYAHGVRAVPVVTCIALSACGIADFDITQPIVEQRIQGSPLPGPLAVLFPLPLSIDIQSKIKEMETGPIDSVTLKSLRLSITDTARGANDTDDWRFIDEIHVFVRSNKSGSTLPRVEIAKVVDPGDVTTLSFQVDGKVNLDPYINEGSVVEGESSGRLPEDDVTYDGRAVFTVHPL
jgi:hypothetical protein